jgi:ferric-dicitrate binding protein FerR (iron transport regulator)
VKPPDPGDEAFDLPEFWRQLEDLEDGELDAEASDRLAALLKDSPSARRAYLEYFQQTAVLRMEAAKLHERGLLPVVGSVVQARRNFRRSVLAAAAVVALAAVIGALIGVARPDPPTLAASVAADTRWSIDGIARDPAGDPVLVSEGSTVSVDSGTLRLELESGDIILLQGPSKVSFPSLNRPQLWHGWLWIDAGKSDEAFAVAAGGFIVRDIGTRFGVRVGESGPVEVHLAEGRVEVSQAESGKLLAGLDSPGRAYHVAADGVIEGHEMAPDPFPALPELLSRPPNYRTTVLAQAPVGYWPLDGPTGNSLANEVAGSSSGFHGLGVRGGAPGPGPDDGYRGFPEPNGSMWLTGSPEKSALVGIDGLHGVRRREGAVSFWIRRPTDPAPRDEVLWLAGSGDGEMRGPNQAIFHSRINAEGRVVFEMRNGETAVRLSTSWSIADGRWHHVAASWGPSSVDLYVDGSLVGRDLEPRTLEGGHLRGRFVRFGKPSSDMKNESHPFTGWVDEIALWDRPLDPVEVACQFEAAKGGGKR